MKVLQNWCQHADIHEIPLSINNIPISKSMMSGSQQHSSLDGTDCGGVQQLTYALTHDVILEESINIIERLIISAAISRHPTLGAAANALGIPRSTFDAKRRKLGII
jgi:DNA-binding NtrC family response regulator